MRAPDAGTLGRAARGEPAAIDELVRTWRPRARAIALRILGDPDEAEDVAQDAVGAALAALPRLRGGASSWIRRVAVNHALNHLRARRRRTRHEARAALERVTVLVPEEPDDRRERVRGEIERLDPLFRECLGMRDVEGLSYEEIAARTGLPIGTVKSRIHRARRRLSALVSGATGIRLAATG